MGAWYRSSAERIGDHVEALIGIGRLSDRTSDLVIRIGPMDWREMFRNHGRSDEGDL